MTFAVAIVVLPFMGIMAGFADIFGNKKQRKVNDYCLDKSYFRILWILLSWENSLGF